MEVSWQEEQSTGTIKSCLNGSRARASPAGLFGPGGGLPVLGQLAKAHGCGLKTLAQLGGDKGRGSLLQDLLVAALQWQLWMQKGSICQCQCTTGWHAALC